MVLSLRQGVAPSHVRACPLSVLLQVAGTLYIVRHFVDTRGPIWTMLLFLFKKYIKQ